MRNGSKKMKHRVFRVSPIEIRLHVLKKGFSSDECIAVYYKNSDGWAVSTYSHSFTKEELNFICSCFPVKGRQYKKEEETAELVCNS